jgi:release factor glutamine methyltransferase
MDNTSRLSALLQRYVSGLEPLYDSREAQSIFFVLLEHLLGTKRVTLLSSGDITLDSACTSSLMESLGRLTAGEPVQYVTGQTEFYGLPFKVDPRVLIPRQETELLVDMIIRDHKHRAGLNVLDIGSGSGCIAIALAASLPGASVCSVDVSAQALELARQNASINGVPVTFLLGDILQGIALDRVFDIVVSNPPYVTSSEKALMHVNVLDHEPHLALFVPDNDPLLFYRAIARQLPALLHHHGTVYLEINEHLGSQTCALLHDHGMPSAIPLDDLNGKTRFVKARWPQ